MRTFIHPGIGILMLLLFSNCEKDIDLAKVKHEDPQLIINGFITDQPSIETITVNWSANLKEEQFPFEDEAIVSVSQGGQTHLFSHQGNGQYRSASPLQAQHGAVYEFSVLVNGVLHKMSGQAPFNTNIISAETQFTSDLNNILQPGRDLYEISCNVVSLADQFVKFHLYEADTIIANDTSWIEVQVGSRNKYHQLQGVGVQGLVLTPGIRLQKEGLIRIELWALDQETGQFLESLSSFSTLNSNEPFGEPLPTLFTNNAYGVCYGTSISTRVIRVN